MMITRHAQEHYRMGTPEELIHRRRRQIIVHSILYYMMDSPVITDYQFDYLAKDLARFQNEHPRSSLLVMYHAEAFKNFTGETGYHLPLADYPAILVARRLWSIHNAQRLEPS